MEASKAPEAAPSGEAAIAAIIECWIGCWCNHRQVDANLARGGRPAPELSRERRRLKVVLT